MLTPLLPTKILNIIKSINPNTATGYDNISSFFLRLGGDVLAPKLSLYFSTAFEIGIFPQIFKTGKVIPIFKSGDKHLLQNYRPISLLPSMSKVFEKLIKNRLMNFFVNHKVFYDSRYGFREKLSVIHALIEVITPLYDRIQDNLHTGILQIDLRKAFDTVSHPILLHKLYHYGIRGPAFSLLESYLSYRCQFVSLNNCHSSSKPINIGVPQGSILGRLLFLMYVNDLSNSTSCNPCLFADDICLVVSNSSFSSLEQNCNAELENLNNWSNANKLQINPKKSISISFLPKLNINEEKLKILYNNCTLACCDSSKYLGVIIDNKLNFQSHIHAIENKVARAVGILSKVRYLFPSSTLLLLYFALIHSHLLFGLVLWGNTYSTYLAKLQRLQNKTICIISKCNYQTPITPHFYKLGILKIADQCTVEVGKMMYQHSKQALPPCISSFFSPISSIHSRRTRSSTKKNLYIPKFSFSRCQKSIKYQGAKI